MPRIVAFYIRSCVTGFTLSAVFVALLLWFDVAGLGGLILGTSEGPLALMLLWFFNGIVFSGAQASVRVLLMAEDGDGGGDGGHRVRIGAPVTAPSAARSAAVPSRLTRLRLLPRRNG